MTACEASSTLPAGSGATRNLYRSIAKPGRWNTRPDGVRALKTRSACPDIPAMAVESSGGEPAGTSTPLSSTNAATDVLGNRILAGFIDLAVLAALFVAMGLLFGGVHSTNATSVSNPTVHQTNYGVSLTNGPLVLFLVLCLSYYFILESRSGQTLGKRATGLRVISIDGGVPTTRAILLRTLGRIIDILPFLYLIGSFCVRAAESRGVAGV